MTDTSPRIRVALAGVTGGAGAPLAALMLGINDFGERMNLVLGPDREPLKPWLAAVVAAARGHGLLAIDGVVNATDDADDGTE